MNPCALACGAATPVDVDDLEAGSPTGAGGGSPQAPVLGTDDPRVPLSASVSCLPQLARCSHWGGTHAMTSRHLGHLFRDPTSQSGHT